MTSLYARAWKTFIHFLVQLFWTFISYLRSLSFCPGERFPTTPKHRGERLERSVVDLEGGESPCDPRLDGQFLSFDMLRSISNVPFPASPATPLTPTPCFRRARASTLYAYTPPNADSTTRRPPVTSRSSGSSLSSTVRSGDDCTSGDPIVYGANTEDRRLSEGSSCSFTTAPCVHSEESIPVGVTIDNGRSIIVLKSEESVSTPEYKTDFIANHRDSRYVNANRIKGVLLKERIPLPFKCLSAMKTLSLRAAPSGSLYARKSHRRVSTIAGVDVSELQLSQTKSSIHILKRSCSVDLGSLQKQQQSSFAVESKAQTRVFTGHPRSAALPLREYRPRTKGASFDNHITAALLPGPQDKSSVNAIRKDSHLSAKGKSGFGTENELCDVSLVKRVFSFMRADDGEQDARNIFNRESVWDFRKSTAPSVKPVSQRFSAGIKPDIFGAPIRKSRLGAAKASSVAFRGTGRIEELPKAIPRKRALKSRHRSAMFGPSPSPSIQCQLRKEKIRRQRKLRQEMMSREFNKSCLGEKARESYDWCAED